MRRLTVAGLIALLGLTAVVVVVDHHSGGASASNCGAVVYKANGTPWRCTFDDEFNGTRLSTSQWVAQTSFATGSSAIHACYVNNPQTLSVSGGALHLSLLRVSPPVACPRGLAPTYYEAGSVSTYHLFSQEYGRFEARVMVSKSTSPGLNEDFWLYPDARYSAITKPDTGEIDISQQFSSEPASSYPYLHYAANGLSGSTVPGTNIATCAAPRGVWNTYDLVWTPTSITISINGTLCLVNTSASLTFHKREMVALTEALGTGTDAATPDTPLPATMSIDYVHVWQ